MMDEKDGAKKVEGPFHVINHSRWLELNLSILLFCKMQEKVMMPYS